MLRTRPDRCPGVLRPWRADDGLLVRLRLVGGRLASSTLTALCAVAREYGDGRVHLTSRANLQLRALPAVAAPSGVPSGASSEASPGAALPAEVVTAIEATGLLPSRSHELARNVLVSPQTGLAGGRADLRPLAADLDRLVCADPLLAGLPGRFLFVLDDGRGDLLDRSADLGLVVLSAGEAQLRIGEGWGPVVPLEAAAAALVELATAFMAGRGEGPEAAWHVPELSAPLGPASPADPRLPAPSPALPFGRVAGGVHVGVPTGVEPALAAELRDRSDELVVTPWRGVLVPEPEEDR
ncbi:nitrite reductase [Nocardioides sp. BP30]|uniref:nitrite reductase n=1 Tax=Nocardioides sp. BP30 TaxID=3036374 RepID=UPI0024685575|nr:nitrite reductase [Nocardioides sp. BP30]WGL51286.1 nitrite reductase [Nocardioides sp. BP30]